MALTEDPSKLRDPEATPDDRTYALMMHLALLLNLTGLGGVISFLVVLVMWLVKRGDSAFIDDHGREAVNFQITLFVYMILFGVLGVLTCGVGWILLVVPPVLGAVGMILASFATQRGEYFRYPATIRLLG